MKRVSILFTQITVIIVTIRLSCISDVPFFCSLFPLYSVQRTSTILHTLLCKPANGSFSSLDIYVYEVTDELSTSGSSSTSSSNSSFSFFFGAHFCR